MYIHILWNENSPDANRSSNIIRAVGLGVLKLSSSVATVPLCPPARCRFSSTSTTSGSGCRAVHLLQPPLVSPHPECLSLSSHDRRIAVAQFRQNEERCDNQIIIIVILLISGRAQEVNHVVRCPLKEDRRKYILLLKRYSTISRLTVDRNAINTVILSQSEEAQGSVRSKALILVGDYFCTCSQIGGKIRLPTYKIHGIEAPSELSHNKAIRHPN